MLNRSQNPEFRSQNEKTRNRSLNRLRRGGAEKMEIDQITEKVAVHGTDESTDYIKESTDFTDYTD
jgi:hypothetical protein